MAESIINENASIIGRDIADKAKANIEKEQKKRKTRKENKEKDKGGEIDEKTTSRKSTK